MTAERKLAAILAADVVGYSRLTGFDEDGTIVGLRSLKYELINPAISTHRGRIVKTTGDGVLVEFASAVDAVRGSLDVQPGMVGRNTTLPTEKRIDFRVGINVGDIVADGHDLLGDGVNIAARLEGIADPGGICVSEDAHRHVRGKVDAEFIDLGEQALKNIARPVRVYRIDIGGTTKPQEFIPEAGQQETSPRQVPAVSTAPRLSIVVLPFTNIGGDPEQEYFVDGVTESLTTDLSRISGSFVIARDTAFTYKGRPFDVTRIGRELNVRYVLEGSVQRGGGRMRVNVQLIDAETGNHLWAERFDKPIADLFDMQDEIVARLAGTLNTQLIAAEARRVEHAPNLDSMDLYCQGATCLNKGATPQNMAEARGYFERALALDSGNLEALIGTAYVDLRVGGVLHSADHAARLANAEATLLKALSLAPDHALARCLLGSVQVYTDRAAQGIAELERALQLDRNLALAHAFIGHAKTYSGGAEECEAHVQEALRLSPRDAYTFAWLASAAFAKLHVGADEDAAQLLRRSIETNRNLAAPHFWLAAALAGLGRLDEARASAVTGLTLNAAFTVARIRADAPSRPPVLLAQRERIYDLLRKAGVPEG